MSLSVEFDVTTTRTPFANALFIGATFAFSVLAFFQIIPGDLLASMKMSDWSLSGLVGGVFVHENVLVLLGGMFFVWVFGNGVCSTVGNVWYLFIVLLLGIISSSVYFAGGAGPAIGVSGVLSGLVGMSLVLFPAGKVYWMTFFWLALDMTALHFFGTPAAAWGHVAGFLGGAGVAAILLTSRAVITFDPTLIDILTGNKPRNIIDTPEPLQAAIHASRPANLGTDRSPRTFVINGRREGHVDPEAERIHRLMTGENRKRPRPGNIDPGPPLDLRVLRLKTESNQTTCYFIYQGEEIHDLSATGSPGVTVAVHPPRVIRRGEPGWFTFVTNSGAIPADPRFILEYTTSSGERHRRAMAFSHYDNRILSGAEA
jgi:membrane associated rhomboid family serine protease